MSEKSEDPDDDAATFADAVRDVTPLRPHNLAVVRPPRPTRTSEQHAQSRSNILQADGESGCVAKSGIQQIVLRRIRNGQIPVEGELDLHGLGLREAEIRLQTFLQSSRTERQRLVRVIHGKGHGSPNQESILRAKVSEWLSESDWVLAFCPAGPCDGGSGAVRVLLKRRG